MACDCACTWKKRCCRSSVESRETIVSPMSAPVDAGAKPGTAPAFQELLDELHDVDVPLEVDIEVAVEQPDLADGADRVAAQQEPEEAVVDPDLVDGKQRAPGVLGIVDGDVADLHRSEERGRDLAVGDRTACQPFELPDGVAFQRFHPRGERAVELHRREGGEHHQHDEESHPRGY